MKEKDKQKSEWPEHFPESCPPPDADETEGLVYRWVSSNGFSNEDFESHWILNPSKREAYIERRIHCESCGLSVAKSVNDAKKIVRRCPHIAKDRQIAVAKLYPSMGRMKNTFNKSWHYTWWIPLGIDDVSTYFKVVA